MAFGVTALHLFQVFIAAVLPGALGAEPFHLVAIIFGGAIAVGLALSHVLLADGGILARRCDESLA